MKSAFALAFGTILAAGCTGTSPTATSQTALAASATAKRFGVDRYELKRGLVYLYDRDGVELGHIEASAPEPDRRLFLAELTDGTQDNVEVYRPLSDGSFAAPIVVETQLSAVLADAALAPVWARLGVRVTPVGEDLVQATGTVAPSDVANTTPCSGVNSDTPIGCARLANPAVGCTNPSQLPPRIVYDQSHSDMITVTTSPQPPECMSDIAMLCASTYGGTYTDWHGYMNCVDNGDGTYYAYCNYRDTQNSWSGSCPRISCATPGQYDAVPRRRTCRDPGSCTKDHGTVTCTPYH